MDPLIYHTHHSLRSEDLTFWRDFAEEMRGPVLELGCGTGRVLLRLINEGLQVHGIDNDPEMLTFMKRMIPPKLSWQVEVDEADLRTYDLGKQFPLIILPCNTLSTFTSQDRERIYERTLKHITPGGKFIFSIPNILVLKELPEKGPLEIEDEFSHPTTGNLIRVYSSWEKRDRSINFYWRYDLIFPDDRIASSEHETSHFLDPPQNYLSELRAAGYTPSAVYGDFLRAPFAPDSAYFILVAEPQQ